MAERNAEETIKVDLNKVGLDQLALLPMVGRERARKIIDYRNEHGPFKSWSDLDNIPGFSKSMVENIRKTASIEGQ